MSRAGFIPALSLVSSYCLESCAFEPPFPSPLRPLSIPASSASDILSHTRPLSPHSGRAQHATLFLRSTDPAPLSLCEVAVWADEVEVDAVVRDQVPCCETVRYYDRIASYLRAMRSPV
eukprot:2929247-Rhodomonas_salina.1